MAYRRSSRTTDYWLSGLIYNLWLCVVGGLFVLAAGYGWVFEPVDDPNDDGHHDHEAHGTSEETRAEEVDENSSEEVSLLTETATTETSNDHSEDHGSTLGVSNGQIRDVGLPRFRLLALWRAYFNLHAVQGPNTDDLGPEEMFDIPFTSVSSFVLLMSFSCSSDYSASEK